MVPVAHAQPSHGLHDWQESQLHLYPCVCVGNINVTFLMKVVSLYIYIDFDSVVYTSHKKQFPVFLIELNFWENMTIRPRGNSCQLFGINNQ